jgi:hypothetical protein
MFNLVTSPSIESVAAGEPEPERSPTVTRYQQVAAELNAVVDGVRAAVPALVPITPESKAFIRRKRDVSPVFVNAAVGSLLIAPDFQRLGDSLSGDGAIDDGQYIDGLRPLMMNVVLLGRQLEHTLKVREAELATKAQKAYAVARALAIDPQEAEIVWHVENMRRARRRPKG